MLPPYLTEGVLRDRLAELGHAPRFGHELAGFEQDGKGVTARLAKADGTTARCGRAIWSSDAALAAVIAARTGRADIAVHTVHWRTVPRTRCSTPTRRNGGR